MPQSWEHAVRSVLRLASFTWQYVFKAPLCLFIACELISYYFWIIFCFLDVSVYLSIHLLKGILMMSEFWQRCIKLLQTSMGKFLCRPKAADLLGAYQECAAGSRDKNALGFIRKSRIVSHSGCTFLHSRQSAWDFRPFHNPSIWCCPWSGFGHPARSWRHPSLALICISLVTCHGEHLFAHLSSMYLLWQDIR